MAKKLGKFLLFTAAAGSAAAAIYYYMQKKDAARKASEDDDYDDFSEDKDKASESSHNYVPLTPDSPGAAADSQTEEKEADKPSAPEASPAKETSDANSDSKSDDFSFTPLSKQVYQNNESSGETVENFFNEDQESEKAPAK